LSTRTPSKFASIAAHNITPHAVNIDVNEDISNFLNSPCLIVNITSKNIDGFRQLITQIESSPVQHVIFISSSSVYKSTNGIVTEDAGYENTDSLLFQIETLFQENSHFDTTILRLSGLIGYNRHPGNFFRNDKQVQQADAPVNLIHRDDCIGLIDAIIKQSKWGFVFNGCADTHPTKRDFYSYARALLAKPNPIFADNDKLEYKIISNIKVKQQLNYHFIYPDIMTIPFGEQA